MKTLLKFILIAIFAILMAIAINNTKNGYVILFVDHYRLDFSLISGIILILLVFMILHYLIRIYSGIENIPSTITKWSKNYALNRRRTYLNSAMISFLAHDYKKSYKMSQRVITRKNNTDEEFIALRIALESSHAVKNSKKEILISELEKYSKRRYKQAKNITLENSIVEDSI